MVASNALPADHAGMGVVGGTALAATAGAAAGAAGAIVLARLHRGVARARWCAPGVVTMWVAVALAAPPWWWIGVPLVLGWLAVLLTITDLAHRRLPDALTLPAYPVTAALLAVAAYGSGDGGLAARGLLGAALWAGGYAAIRLIAPAALGGGDVKLAGSLGAVTAAVSWSGLLLAVLTASVLTAAVAAAAAPFGHRDVAHGPAMLGAAWLVVLSAPT